MILLPRLQGRAFQHLSSDAGRRLLRYRKDGGAWRRVAYSQTSKATKGDKAAEPVITQNYLEREKKIQSDVTSMRQQAQDNMKQALSDLRAAAASKLRNTAGSGAQDASLSLDALRVKLKNAISVMQHGLTERDTEVRLLLLATMSGEHILLIGPPGTAKSEVSRRLNKLVNGKYFERLLTRFSVPEELFGPLSMRALEDDQYVRQTTGYLPEAEVAFIDEIFKANSAILNTLLTLINERQFDNGPRRVDVPLLSVVGASNELPESEELDALYDRFLVRRSVKQVSPAGVVQMLGFFADNTYQPGPSQSNNGSSQPAAAPAAPAAAGSDGDSMMLTRDDIVTCKREALRTVKVPMNIIQMVTDLRTYLQEKIEPPIYVSDRRLIKSLQLLQVAAYCNGRNTVTEYDLLLLQHVLWQKPEQADRIHDWVMGQLSVDDGAKQVKYLLSGLFSRACRSLGDTEKGKELLTEVSSLRNVLGEKFIQILSSLDGERFQDNLWLSADEAEAVATALEPKLGRTRSEVETVLMDVSMLELAVTNQSSPVALASLMPRHWADFIRNSDIKDVKPIGPKP